MLLTCVGVSHGEEGVKNLEGEGLINRMTDKEIVINDCLYALKPWTVFNTSTMKNAPRGWIHVGDYVRFIINDKRQVLSLWLIEKENK